MKPSVAQAQARLDPRSSPSRRVSIVVPALNEAGTIAATLRTLVAARMRGTELIVVDGGSEDRTVHAARPFAERVVVAPRGRASQLNAGAAAATGEVLLFLHADSHPPCEADRVVLEAIGAKALAWGRFDVRIESERKSLRLVSAMMNVRSRASGIATGDQGIFATRALFERIGGFPPQPLMEDIAFCRAAKRIAAPICLHQVMLTSGRRWEQQGVLRTVLLMWRLRLAYFLGADPRALSARYDQVR
ncbi:MAG: TIGR04283 family arsenosugar biosynthesis glycosyltransferase [Burkholderiales bacterium]|nr:TIGR04283 family arsenosugar biosynthesis glycosyltransferase [Burkholderiales bacterium]